MITRLTELVLRRLKMKPTFVELWFRRLFVSVLPIRLVLRIFDIFANEGQDCFFRVALALLHMHTDILLYLPCPAVAFMNVALCVCVCLCVPFMISCGCNLSLDIANHHLISTSSYDPLLPTAIMEIYYLRFVFTFIYLSA